MLSYCSRCSAVESVRMGGVCRVCDLDGDPPRGPVSTGFIVAFATGLVALLVAMALLTSCAPRQPPRAPELRTWAYDQATVVVPLDAPPCLLWTVQEAWEFLGPRVAVTIRTGWPKSPADGEIALEWSKPESSLGLATLWGDRPAWKDSRRVTRALVQVNECKLRLVAHELGHALGLVNVEEPSRLMTRVYREGGYALTAAERVALARR